eukprot:3676077-Amphidinium_carterae.1
MWARPVERGRTRRLCCRNQRVVQDPRWCDELRIHDLQQSRPGMRRFLALLGVHVAVCEASRAGTPAGTPCDLAKAITASVGDER